MPIFDDFLKIFPEKTLEILNPLWEALPEDDRQALKEKFEGLPLNLNLVNMLIDLAVVQAKVIVGHKSQVVIVGPANVGKSTLYNHLVREKADHAEVSPVPGTTRINQIADAGVFAVIDTPGADAVGPVGEKEKEEALNAAQEADFLVIMFDAIQGIKDSELQLYRQLTALHKPHLVVLNKIDLVSGKHEPEVIGKAASNLGLEATKVIPISAKRGLNVPQVLLGIVIADPQLLIPMAQALPHYRWKLTWRVIVTAAIISGTIALVPLPLIDFIPLITNQATMVLSIARIHNYRITLKRARELVATFGIGLLARTLFQQLSKLGGVPGWLLSSAIAAATTVAMGYAASVWFEKGERLNQKTFNTLTKNLTKFFVDNLKTRFKRKPSKKSFEQALQDTLEDSGLSDLNAIDQAAKE
ncbi:MAG: GTP-binding protein [Chloroflexi bacterium]|nr:GTP-binding protein [Chloroflexota bacterium]